MALLVKQEQVEQAVWEDTLHKSVPVEKQVNLDCAIPSPPVTTEGWVQAGWDRVVRELLLITVRGEGHVLKGGLEVVQVE